MDDLIVIILTLIFAAAGIFGQMKKKQAANRAGEEPESQSEPGPEDSGNFWDFLDNESEYTEQQATVPESPQQKPPVHSVKEEPAKKKKPAYNFFAEKESDSIYSTDLTSDEEFEKSKKRSQRDRFPLKKAVIYSEILNRKYI